MGFTIVEAIATIFLISIIFFSIPAILSQSVESDRASLEAEALYHATALINRISTMPFNSVLTTDDINATKIVDINTTDRTLREKSLCEALLHKEFPAKRVCLEKDVDNKVILPEPRSNKEANANAINQFHEYEKEIEGKGYKLKVEIGYLDEKYLEPNEVMEWDLSKTGENHTNLIVISVTALYENDEPIGTLKYVAANIGAIVQ